MQKLRTVISGLVIAGLAFAGACSDVPPTEPAAIDDGSALLFGGPPPNPQSFDGTLDHHFLRIAGEVPGFGGYYRGEDGTLTVVMKAGASAAPLSAQLGAFNVVAGQYDFVELEAMKRQVGPVLQLAGVYFVDADEAANRVRIGVEHASAERAVSRALSMLGVPSEAVIFSRTEPIIPMQTVRDFHRPVVGGLQINWPGFLCTLGYNVRSPEQPGIHGFITNSHCTSVRGQVTGTPYGQPVQANHIGMEVHDLPFFQGGACPPGFLCRWSDSAGALYAAGVDNAHARIARTTGLGSLTIDTGNPYFHVTAERAFPLMNERQDKVGRTTGWTTGTVVGSCVDTQVGASNIMMLCQDHVQGTPPIVLGGDSGSPVFDFFGGGPQMNVRAHGLLWGGTADGGLWAQSSMNEIRFENTPPPGTSYVFHQP